MFQRRPGIRCPVCESPATSVKETRKGHRHITRRRKCTVCCHTFGTIELNTSHIPSDAKFDFLFRKEHH
jgi:transcriptional regulator NrdR family protein